MGTRKRALSIDDDDDDDDDGYKNDHAVCFLR
jgi:hypothetical protein